MTAFGKLDGRLRVALCLLRDPAASRQRRGSVVGHKSAIFDHSTALRNSLTIEVW